MKRKEKAIYWTEQISEYRQSGESLAQWCEKKDIKIYTMKYWLRKESPILKKQETAWVSCVVEEPSRDKIILKIKSVEIEVMSGFRDKLLLRILRTL
ncbi:IS66 family insertion sequence element accessory protein TnpA [Sporosarcina sp. CAU 1771]